MLCSHAARLARSGSRTPRVSSGSGIGASSRRITNSRETRAWSAWVISSSRRLDGFIAGAAASTPSRSPNSDSNWQAVFGPMPGTPGTLSTLSPIRASRSIIFSGPQPNFSRTSSGPIDFCLIGSCMITPGRISCIRSLSEDTMVTWPPCFHRGLGVGGDQVVRLPVGQLDGGDVERQRGIPHQGELRDQLRRWLRPLRLVGVVDAVAERRAAGVEDDGDVRAGMVLQQPRQHVGEAEHGVHRRAVGPGHRRQRVEGAEDEPRPVHEHQMEGRCLAAQCPVSDAPGFST